MKQNNIDHAAMLCLSQLYCNGWKKEDCIDSITFQNNFNASIQNDFPKTFTSGFVVQPLHMDHGFKRNRKMCQRIEFKITMFTYTFFKLE